MEKISGILPSSPRVTSVDLRDSGPVRAGTVSFGQEQASSAPASRRSAHTRELPFPEMEGASSRPMTKDEQQAEMVRKMNDRFFNTKRVDSAQTPSGQAPQGPSAQQPTASSVEQAVTVAPSPAQQQQAKIEAVPEKPEEELEGGPTGFFKNAPAVDELYPKGSFLNTVA